MPGKEDFSFIHLIPRLLTTCQETCEDFPEVGSVSSQCLIGKETEAEVTSPSAHYQCDVRLEYEPSCLNPAPSLIAYLYYTESVGISVLLLEAPNKGSMRDDPKVLQMLQKGEGLVSTNPLHQAQARKQ